MRFYICSYEGSNGYHTVQQCYKKERKVNLGITPSDHSMSYYHWAATSQPLILYSTTAWVVLLISIMV